MSELFGITLGDASGVGPEILLKAFRDRQIAYPVVVYGALAALRYYDALLGFQTPLKPVQNTGDADASSLNVFDHHLLEQTDITPGEISAKSGHAAREYVISATKAALAGDIAAMVTLPMNKEATQLTDPGFVG